MAKSKATEGNTAVKVRWVPAFGERTVDELVWNEGNGFVTEVSDPAMVKRLLANGDFAVVDEVVGTDNGAE